MRQLNFLGKDIDADKVTAVDIVTTHRTGSLSCDWEFGFSVHLGETSILFTIPKPYRFGHAGCSTTREQYKKQAEAERSKFVSLVFVK